MTSLPRDSFLLRITLLERLIAPDLSVVGARARADTLLVHARLGAGRARRMAVDGAFAEHKFVPFAAVATRLARRDSVSGVKRVQQHGLMLTPHLGHAYATLPLPVSTGGLRFDISAGWELSTNRRELWTAADIATTGTARVKATWNANLLLDVVAPSVGRALVDVARLVTACGGGGGGGCVCTSARGGSITTSPQPACARPRLPRLRAYWTLWPRATIASPWSLVASRLLELIDGVPLFYSKLDEKEAVRWSAAQTYAARLAGLRGGGAGGGALVPGCLLARVLF